MIRVRKASDRGHANHGWLDTFHSFSFADYYDPDHSGFHDLLVINEDRVAAAKGFGTHGHRDMEIITYVLEGELEHKDSLGTGSVIRPGDVQRMSAGTGVRHSEFNHLKDQALHLLQIWILPKKEGAPPGYEQKYFTPEQKTNRLRLVGSRDGREGSVTIHQDVALYDAHLAAKVSVKHALAPGRAGWIQITRGALTLNGIALEAGDGAAIEAETSLTMTALRDSDFLFFDLA